MALFNFKTDQVAARDILDVLPAGWYVAQVTESAVAQNKKATGDVLSLTLDILDGQFRGRKIWARLNVKHQNEVAERIGQQQLRQLCEGVGIAGISDTTQLHMKPVMVKLKVRAADGDYEASNEIAGFKAVERGQAAAPAAQAGGGFPGLIFPPPSAAAAAAAGNTPPWQR